MSLTNSTFSRPKRGYLSVFTTGKILSPAGNFSESEHDVRRAFISPVKSTCSAPRVLVHRPHSEVVDVVSLEIFSSFGLEAIVIWVAILCKKRIFVYSDKLTDLIAAIRCFPAIGAWHRQVFTSNRFFICQLMCVFACQSWDLVRPFMSLTEPELKDLSLAGVYVAGFTDPECSNKKDYYDLFIHLPNKTFSIPDHAKGTPAPRFLLD